MTVFQTKRKSPCFYRLVTLASSGMIVVCTVCAAVLGAEEQPKNERTKEIITLTKKMPAWPFRPGILRDEERLARAKGDALEVEKVAASIAKYELDDIREAMKELALLDDHEIEEKLFILNQYIFDIPEQVKLGSTADLVSRHGYVGLPVSEKTPIWPWHLEGERLRFGIESHGYMRMGPPYEAVKKFDALRKQFGRRSAKAPKKEN